MSHMNRYGRVSVCGSISSYNEKDLNKVKGLHTDDYKNIYQYLFKNYCCYKKNINIELCSIDSFAQILNQWWCLQLLEWV